RRVCCCRPSARHRVNDTVAPPVLQLFIFEMIGQILEYDCHLTAGGYGDRTEEPVASCWIEPCPDQVSRAEWAESAHTIHLILNTIREPRSAEGLVEEGDLLCIQLFYEPPEGRMLHDSLPVFGRDGRRDVPMSLSDVPFGRLHFLFTINYSHDLTAIEDSRMIYAEI
ncbi:hypothetical protein LXA43DRAFT_869481, partial [Ganoderma leucocontextum]